MTQLDMLDGRRKKRNRFVAPLESKEQEALFQWAKVAEKRYPCLWLLMHIPNGGGRTPWEGRAFKRRGVKPGVPDIFLPVGRKNQHGLWIELKRRGCGKQTTPLQDQWLNHLRGGGYAAEVCEGWEAAKNVIEAYLNG